MSDMINKKYWTNFPPWLLAWSCREGFWILSEPPGRFPNNTHRFCCGPGKKKNWFHGSCNFHYTKQEWHTCAYCSNYMEMVAMISQNPTSWSMTYWFLKSHEEKLWPLYLHPSRQLDSEEKAEAADAGQKAKHHILHLTGLPEPVVRYVESHDWISGLCFPIEIFLKHNLLIWHVSTLHRLILAYITCSSQTLVIGLYII